jgi:hypothetical protein
MRQAMLMAHAMTLEELDARAKEHAEASDLASVKANYDMLHGQLQQKVGEIDKELYGRTGGGGAAINWQQRYLDDQRAYNNAALKGELGPNPKPFPSMGQYLASQAGGGGGPLAVGVGKAGQAPVDLSGIEAAGKRAQKSAGFESAVGGILPAWLAPQSNVRAIDVGNWNATVQGTLKQIEPRLSPELLREQAKHYEIRDSDPDEVKAARVREFLQRAQTGIEVGKGKPASTGETE